MARLCDRWPTDPDQLHDHDPLSTIWVTPPVRPHTGPSVAEIDPLVALLPIVTLPFPVDHHESCVDWGMVRRSTLATFEGSAYVPAFATTMLSANRVIDVPATLPSASRSTPKLPFVVDGVHTDLTASVPRTWPEIDRTFVPTPPAATAAPDIDSTPTMTSAAAAAEYRTCARRVTRPTARR
jgi:hypothetical protein